MIMTEKELEMEIGRESKRKKKDYRIFNQDLFYTWARQDNTNLKSRYHIWLMRQLITLRRSKK